MNRVELLPLILVVALVTYLLRVFPIALLRKPVREKHIVAFIKYLPYAILSAMVLPSAFSATGEYVSSAVGLAVAVIFALWGKSLPIVALAATIAAVVAHYL